MAFFKKKFDGHMSICGVTISTHTFIVFFMTISSLLLDRARRAVSRWILLLNQSNVIMT